MAEINQLNKEKKNLKNSEAEGSCKKMCRICLEENDIQMISPCACFGYSKYVHEKCLKTWINVKFKNFKEASCEVCKEKFAINRIRHINCKKKIDPQDINFTFIKVLIIGITMFISSFGSMIIMILFLDRGRYSIFFGLSILIFFPAILFSVALVTKLLFNVCVEVTYESVLGVYDSHSMKTNLNISEPISSRSLISN